MRSVLVVEDDAVYREAVVRALVRSGYEASSASGVAEAEQAAIDDPPELAVVDLRLGDGSGIDVVHALVREAPGCRIVMLSGHGTIRSAVEAMRAGAVDFLTKPVSSAEIVKALQDAEKVVPISSADGSLDTVSGSTSCGPWRRRGATCPRRPAGSGSTGARCSGSSTSCRSLR